ncbi:MAG: tail fiber domain-containing protein [Bacteroidia bacterium]
MKKFKTSISKVLKTVSFVSLVMISIAQKTIAQNVGIGAASFTPDLQSIFEVQSTSKGILIPRMTDLQRTSIAPTPSSDFGLLVYQTNNGFGLNNVAGYWYWDGASWVRMGSAINWNLTGNAGTNAASNFIGTTDATDFVMRTGNVERARISSVGNFGIGTTNPSNTLSVGNGSISKLNISGLDGDVTFTDPAGSVTFPAITASGNPAMMYMFNNFSSFSRMVLAHSIFAPGRGLLYDDATDKFQFTPDGGTTTKLSVSTISTTNIVGIGTNSPTKMLSVAAGMNVDNNNANAGNLTNSITFGLNSEEGIASKRTAGGNVNGLDFYQNSINRMRIWNDGRICMGQNSAGGLTPEADLTILNPTATSTVDIPVFTARISGSAGTTWRMGSVEYYTEGLDNIGFTDKLCPLNGDGSANLGSTSASKYLGYRWGTVYTTGGVNTSSDTTLKQNIQPVVYGLNQLRNIRPIAYKFKKDFGSTDKELNDEDKRIHLGFNAQELKQILPEVVSSWDFVSDNEKGFKKAKTETLGVYYDEVIPVVVNAVKDLDKQQQAIIENINISDFGTEQRNESEIKVMYNSDFAKNLQGKPVVTVTSLQPAVTLYVSEVTDKGFTVKSNSITTTEVSFNWIAMSKINKDNIEIKSSYTAEDHAKKLKAIESFENSLPTAKEVIESSKAKAVSPSKN